MKHKVLIISAILMIASCSGPMKGLKDELESLACSIPAEVGIAVISGNDTICVNPEKHFPMFSVVKFHQAIAVCETASLDSSITVSPMDLKAGTWSPMRERFPDGGTFSIRQLLEYSLIESDNNACDILFENIVSPLQVDSMVHSLGISDCKISWTEDEQHYAISRCYENWTTPLAAARLLGILQDIRLKDERFGFVWDTMSKCSTGENRIPKYISGNVNCIVHKTGTGPVLSDGMVTGICDVACIEMKDGSHFELAVFIKDASCDPAECEELIAQIADTCLSNIFFVSSRYNKYH